MGDSFQTAGGKEDPALPFAKLAGGGNDFVIIDNRGGRVREAAELTRRICTRALSIGADGLILIEGSERASFRMRYYNADGSLGEFCGNGTRCAARYARLEKIAPQDMTIETDAGIVSAQVAASGEVTISVPPPREYRAERPLVVGEKTVAGSSVEVGVPHYVLFVDDLWTMDIAPLGPAIRNHRELQPRGSNVNFVHVAGRQSIEVRTWERGVEGETLACGSGVVASVAVATWQGRVQSPVNVLTRSGITLRVQLAGGEGEATLTGDARLVFRGVMTEETTRGFDPAFVRDPSSAVMMSGVK